MRHLLKLERRKQPLAPRGSFLRRLAYAAILSTLVLTIWTIIGMIGYHSLANLSWVDAFLNTAMIVGGMGPVDLLTSESAKIFAGFYAIFSGVVFLSIFGLLIAPVFHRFLHRFHLDDENRAEPRRPESKGK
jgi:hypothetical protein